MTFSLKVIIQIHKKKLTFLTTKVTNCDTKVGNAMMTFSTSDSEVDFVKKITRNESRLSLRFAVS